MRGPGSRCPILRARGCGKIRARKGTWSSRSRFYPSIVPRSAWVRSRLTVLGSRKPLLPPHRALEQRDLDPPKSRTSADLCEHVPTDAVHPCRISEMHHPFENAVHVPELSPRRPRGRDRLEMGE